MKIGVIDIGSNSVRLALSADGKTLFKRIKTTRLSEGLSSSGKLCRAAIERTAQAVAGFKLQAQSERADKVFAFATAAVRSASNGSQFTAYVKENYGIDIEVISGQTEAKIGLLGALGTSDGGIIDLGGASCEVTVRDKGNTVYTKSVDVGAVRLLEECGRDKDKLEKYISKKLSDYGVFNADKYKMYGVSGTATTLAAVKQNLKEYDPQTVHGTRLSVAEVGTLAEQFLKMSVDEIKRSSGILVWRADVIGGASLFLYRLMQYMSISEITVSENDNLEGYLIYKGEI